MKEAVRGKYLYGMGAKMTKVKNNMDLEIKKIRFIRELKLNAWCWLFMALAVGFYILFQGYQLYAVFSIHYLTGQE